MFKLKIRNSYILALEIHSLPLPGVQPVVGTVVELALQSRKINVKREDFRSS
jgi:hypothetical protein